MADLQITYQLISALKPRPANPRTHTQKQIEQIATSIKRFGFTNPVLIDDENGIVAGHGRVEAAALVGIRKVPTVRLTDMTEANIRAYVIADNKLAENAGWDRELLGLELQYLSELDIDFDVTITGFDIPEIDVLISDLSLSPDADGEADALDAVPKIGDGPATTRTGDLWRIGEHRLICGDAVKRETYAQLLGDELAQMVFSDPPYNVPIDGHVSGLGKTRHREFAMAFGEMTDQQFTTFLTDAFEQLGRASFDGSLHFICMDWRHMGEILAAGDVAYSRLKNVCVWAKSNGGMGSLYRSQHELVFVFKLGTAPHINNVELGKYGRYRTNLWSYPGANAFGAHRDDLSLHPTVKPVALVADAIRDCSHAKHIVLDAFAGSGTTLIAAEITRRRGFGIEIDALYCDVIINRMRNLCGLDAVLETSGETFDEVAARRACAPARNDTNQSIEENTA